MKALIVFDTKHGATEEVAGKIAQAVRDKGNEADLLDLRKKESFSLSLEAYDAVALGAPFYMGQWSKRARAFAAQYGATAYDGWHDLVADAALDAVIITSPPDQTGSLG